jgi:hypothetical protein
MGDRFGAGQVGGHRLHTLGQASGPGAADDGTDLGALVDEDVDQGMSDGTGRSGHEDHAKTSYLHGCLNKIQYLGKYRRWSLCELFPNPCARRPRWRVSG